MYEYIIVMLRVLATSSAFYLLGQQVPRSCELLSGTLCDITKRTFFGKFFLKKLSKVDVFTDRDRLMIPVAEKKAERGFFFYHDNLFISARRWIELPFKNEKCKIFRLGSPPPHLICW